MDFRKTRKIEIILRSDTAAYGCAVCSIFKDFPFFFTPKIKMHKLKNREI